MEALEIPCVEHELDDRNMLDIDDADPWALNVVVECKKCGKTGIGIIWADRVMWDEA